MEGATTQRLALTLKALWGLELTLVVLLIPAALMTSLAPPLLVATWLLVHSLRTAMVASRVLDRAFVIAFGVGNLGSMVFANAGYVLFTDLPQYGDHTDSMWLTNALVAASMLGGFLVERVLSLQPIATTKVRDDLLGWEALLVTGVFYIAVTTLMFYAAGNTRWNPEEVSGGHVLALGTERIADTFFFVLGYQLRTPLWQLRNGLLGSAGLALSLTAGLIRGYRVTAMLNLLIFVVGALFKARHMPRLRMPLLVAGLAAVPVITLYFEAVGIVRNDFANEGFVERVALTGEEIGTRLGESSAQEPDDGSVFGRLFELPGQDVIARLKPYGGYDAGFEDFDRLLYVMVPAFIAPEKKDPDVGPEILARDFHYYTLNESYTVPITLVADAYRRGGLNWVLGVGLLLGIWLRVMAVLTKFLARGPMFEATMAATALRCLRLYPDSVTGVISATSWYWLKELFLFAVAGFLVTVLRQLGRSRMSMSQQDADHA